MGRPRMLRPEVVRLALSDGDYVDVKKHLNAGETRKLLVDQMKDQVMGDRPQIDHKKLGISKLLAYLIGWSLCAFAEDDPIPYSLDLSEEVRQKTLDDLDPDTYRELIAVIDDHETRVETELAARKNELATGNLSSRTLSSPNSSAGDMTGSALSR